MVYAGSGTVWENLTCRLPVVNPTSLVIDLLHTVHDQLCHPLGLQMMRNLPVMNLTLMVHLLLLGILFEVMLVTEVMFVVT